MGLTTAMYTGLSGLNVNQSRIETIGNNIANVNTTAFKGSRTLFQTQFAQTLSMGTPPSDTSGGTNPMQFGLGAIVGSTQRMLNSGSIETTGLASDLAIEGAGYFAVKDAGGRLMYTRDGAFAVNANNQLVSADGYRVQGYGVDQSFHITPGVLTDLTIPLGKMTIARATQNVVMDGDLSAAGTPATQGSVESSQALVAGGGGAAAGSTLLTDLRSAAAPGTTLFQPGNTITLSGASKGDRDLPTQQFVVGTTGNTLGDLASWLQSAMGVQTGAGVPGSPGVTVQGGQLVINSNIGTQNGILIETADVTSNNAATPLPFQFTQTQQADGSSVFTSFTAYDSLGNPLTVYATFVQEAAAATGPVWRYYLESPDNAGQPRALGNGTVSFDTQGNFLSVSGNQFTVNRTGTGAANPVTFALDLSHLNGLSTQTSNVILGEQDGFPPGTLSGFGVGNDGTITGAFSNGLSRTLGQVALATFANEDGLVAEADNMLLESPASGPAAVTAPGSLGAGLIRAGALELSNVDLSREFIGLITSSAGYQASSRVISVSSDLLNQLMVTLR
jgi:flagellar hook protein FlgE